MIATAATIAKPVEVAPSENFALLDLEGIFGRVAPFEVDLGCGDGSFLVAAAAANPARNFLGIERLVGRVRSACRRVERDGVHNARVLHGEISYALRQLLPAGSVTVFHLMFPDPWPKRRHASRRIVSQEFLTLLGRALAPDGMVWIATDESEYFRKIERLALQSPQFVAIPEQEPQGAVSTFEKRFRQDGLKIHRLVLRKVSDGTKVVASQ